MKVGDVSYSSDGNEDWEIRDNENNIQKHVCNGTFYFGGKDECGMEINYSPYNKKRCYIFKDYQIPSEVVEYVSKVRFSGYIWFFDTWYSSDGY